MTSNSTPKPADTQLDAALIEAAVKSDAVGTALLLEQGADPDVRVASEADAPLLLVVMGWRANPNLRVLSAAHTRAEQSKPIVELLLQAGADIHACAEDGSNALSLTLALGWRDTADYLLDHGIDVNVRSSRTGCTALMHCRDSVLLDRLLERGAMIDAQDNWGNTALLQAVRGKQLTLVKALLERGADIHIKCRNGVDDALSFARLARDQKMVSLLEHAIRKGHQVAEPRLLSLELLTSAPLERMKAFYHQTLGLRVLEAQPDRLTIGADQTRLTFVMAGPDGGNPFYHFAFNIPENKIRAAHTWQKERTELLPIPAGLRDPRYPDDIVNYSHWNAHSLFFYDPGGNVVEYIARHDLDNGAAGPFGSEDLLYASEIGLIVDDVPAAASKLKEIAGVDQYGGGSDQFTALGDERGLLLVMKRGRILNFHPSGTEKAAQVFRTVVRVRGDRRTNYLMPGFPYEISVEE
jgi:hypothetical protein